MVLIPPRWRHETIWVIETDNIDVYRNHDYLTDNNGNNLASINVVTPRTLYQGGRTAGSQYRRTAAQNDRDPNDLVITLQDANRDRFRHITNAEITQQIVNMDAGEIKRSVRVQRVENSSAPGKNKLVVLRNVVDKSKIPHYLEFGQLRMYLRYRGKPYKCTFCNNLHEPGTSCPEEVVVRQMEKERNEAKAKI